MSLTTIFRAAAIGILASTVSAATFNPASRNNVAVYWGQGANQGPLKDVCADPNVDIVNIGFITQFPKAVGDYPVTNFGNACWGWYDLPNGDDGTGYVVKNCNGVEDAIKLCQKNGKKVLLSLGGGADPANYYLPSQKVAAYFGEWLWSAFGPATAEWTNAGKPRPFGNAAIDGFDLDIESSSRWEYYSDFVNNLKNKHQSILFSAAPQCITPDPRLKEAIMNAPFDFIFTQFYNTPLCSARQGYLDLGKTTTTFSFDAWATWLSKNSKNKGVKLYIGLAAGVNGAGAAHPDHYLAPLQAYRLISKYQSHPMFGGAMLWEWTVSVNNKQYGRAYLDWIKYSLDGTFVEKFKPMVSTSSSSVRSSSTLSTKVSTVLLPSSTKASSTPSSTKTPTPSSTKTPTPSSTKVSSTPSSTKASTTPSSTKTAAVPSTVSGSTVHLTSSSYATTSASSSAASTVETYSESVAYSETFSAINPSETYTESVIYSETFSVIHPSSIVSPSEASTVYPTETSEGVSDVHPTATASGSTVYPTETSEGVSEVHPTATSEGSIVYPSATSEGSSVIHPSSTASSSVYPVQNETSSVSEAYSGYPTNAPSIVYPEEVSPTASTGASAYPTHASSSDSYELLSSTRVPGHAASSSSVAEYPVSTTKKPTHPEASYPTGTTTTVVTTTYVDVCPTGLTTKTAVVTQTVCGSCNAPEYPADWTTSVYVSSTLTVTITKPVHATSDVPAHSTVEAVEYPTATEVAEYPTASEVADYYPTATMYPTAVEAAEYPTVPKPSAAHGDDKPTAPEVPAHEVPAHEAPAHEVAHLSSSAAPTTITASIITLTKTPVPHAYTPVAAAVVPAPYASHPAGNGTHAAASSTGMPSPTGYPVVPVEFEGAAGRVQGGVVAAAVVGVFVMLMV